MRNTLFPSRTGLMGQWIFSGLHTCTLMAGHMWFHHWRLSGTCAFFFLSEKKHSFFFFFSFPSLLPSDLMFLLSFRFLKIGTATLLWLPVQLWSSFFFSLMQFRFTIRFDKTPSLLAPNAPSWKVVVGGHDNLCVVRNSLKTGKKINLGDLSWKRVEVLTLVCLG